MRRKIECAVNVEIYECKKIYIFELFYLLNLQSLFQQAFDTLY